MRRTIAFPIFILGYGVYVLTAVFAIIGAAIVSLGEVVAGVIEL